MPTTSPLVLQQIVPDGPEGHEVAYALVVAGGRLRVKRGRVTKPDLTFTQDRVTVEAIHRGELSAQAAFMQGRLRLGGDLRAVIDRARELEALRRAGERPCLSSRRSRPTWSASTATS